jgi:choline dehydrogenase-like flavoprotein
MDAVQRGTRVVVNCTVDRVLIEDRRATGVVARVQSDAARPLTLRVRSGVVVLAAGALNTPVVLQRSGVRGGAVGRHLHLHPGTGVLGIFDDETRPWEGTLQAVYSDQVADLDGRHYGAKLESVPLHPALLALSLPWQRAEQYERIIRALPHLSLVGVLLRDRDGGRVQEQGGVGRVHYRVSAYDQQHVRRGIEAGVRILEAAGAREIFTTQNALISYRPGQAGGVEGYMAEVDRLGYGPGQTVYVSFHQMGSSRMGTDPARSVVGPDAQCHAVKGLFVADASLFPSASGVNPMVTIMAMAHQASPFIARAC